MSELRAPLYARVLGAAWHELPAEIREMHDVHSGLAIATFPRTSAPQNNEVRVLKSMSRPGCDFGVPSLPCSAL